MSEKKRKIRFVVDCTVEDHRKGTPEEESYEKGRTYNLPEASADRWVRRGKAVYPETATKAKDAKSEGGEGAESDGGKDAESDDDNGANKTKKPRTRKEQAAAAAKSK